MSKTFERMKTPTGKVNTNYVDVLDEDKPIAGQKFFAMSFISPEKILREKKIFLFEYFLKYWDFSKSMEKYTQFLNFISFKYKFDNETLMKDLNVDNQSLLNEGYAFFTEEKIIEGLLDKAKASLQKLGRSVKNWFKNIISKIIEGAKKVFDKVKGLGQKAFKVLFNFLGVEMSDAKVRISGIAGAFANK